MIARRNDFVLFLLVTVGVAWAVASGPWLDGNGLRSDLWLHTGAALMMLAPVLGVLAVWRYRRLLWPKLLPQNGLQLGPQPRRTASLIVFAWLGTPLILWTTFGLCTVYGLYVFDFHGPEIAIAALVQAIAVTTLSTLPFALGEELGWRGWLLPQLARRFGVITGILATGIIWALWHAPLTLLGYTYPNLGAWAALAFLGFCIPFGAILGWLRLRTGSIWPCAVAHAAFNANAVVFSTLDATTRETNPLLTGYGFIGWGVLTVTAAILFTWFPVHPPTGRSGFFAAPPHSQPSLG